MNGLLQHTTVHCGKARSPLGLSLLKSPCTQQSLIEEHLFELFPDHTARIVSEDADKWEFCFDWPEHLLVYTDPKLADNARAHYDLPIESLSGHYQIGTCGQSDFVFSMFHSRALLAPAMAAGRRGRSLPKVIVHVDAHSDLGPPLLQRGPNGVLENLYFQKSFQMQKFSSVLDLIDSGLINKGSFLSSYMLAVPGGNFIHIAENLAQCIDYLTPQSFNVKLDQTTISCELLTGSSLSSTLAWRRERSSKLPRDLPIEVAGDIWLDVDLDAFCNRFDGDSDNSMTMSSELELQKLRASVAAFLHDLNLATWRGSISAVSVAVSPGFFPSEYWSEIIPKVCDGIACALSKE